MISRILLGIIRFYQKNISPALGNNCRFTPTCSQYAAEAIEIHGAFIGVLYGFYRILRCNPFSKGGYDPVPQKPQRIKIR